MRLAQVAQYCDVSEAMVAASALRAYGMVVHVQNELHGQNDFFVQNALGGFRLYVPESEADLATSFIAQCRAAPVERIEPRIYWRAASGFWLAVLAGNILIPLVGLMLAL